MDIAKTTTEITLLRRALKTAPTVSIKAKIKSKITRLKQYIDDANVPTVKLAKALLGSKRKVLGYSTQEFNDAIGRLSMKGEYSFLKGMGKGKIKDDLKREAKPVGYRFVGRDNFKKPTRQEIIDGRKKGTVYMESRANRSDVVRPAKLEYGGIITQEQYDEITTEHRPFAVKSGSSIHDVINSTIALNLACKKRDVSVQDYKNYGKFAKGGSLQFVGMNSEMSKYELEMLQGKSANKGVSIEQMNTILSERFPYSFGFSLNDAKSPEDLRYLKPNQDNPLRGIKDSGIKISFNPYHGMDFRVFQGGENTYFYFLLYGSDDKEYIGEFGFKDKGDVPKEYVTSFISFLCTMYDFPYKVSHNVYAKGGAVEHGLKKGDTIKDDLFWEDSVIVNNSKTGIAKVDLDKGERTQMAKGGGISNQYEGKKAKEIYELWDYGQKFEFFKDHFKDKGVYSISEFKRLTSKKYDELDETSKNALVEHIKDGQYSIGGGVDGIKITKNEYQFRKDEPNRVYHSYEGTLGDYIFYAQTDNSFKNGYGSDGINKGSVYKLSIRKVLDNGMHDTIAEYWNKWDYRTKNAKDGAIRSKIIKYIDSISDEKKGTPKKYADGGGVEFIPEKKGTLIRGNEIIKYFEKANGNYRLVFYTLNETKGKVPTMCDAFGYCEELDVMNITPKQLVELIKKNNLMEYGGGVDENSTRNVTNDMRGEDSDDYGTFEIYKNGGSIEVNVVNSNKRYNEKAYNWILGDFDKDGVPNADDTKPLDKNKTKRIDEPSVTSGIKSLISLKNTLDSKMYSFIDELKDVAPNKSKIYARTKTPYSVLDKLIKKRLSTITDLIGTTVVTNDKNELDTVKKYVESGKMGKVTEFEDMYKSPKKGYRAYHFLIDRDGMSIELQLKTKRQKALNELTHEPYKLGNINVPLQLKMTEVANRADEGDKDAIKDYNEFMKQPNIEKVFYAKSGGKMATGGGVSSNINTDLKAILDAKRAKIKSRKSKR
jgi:ppGpp synthetase/RelA/SpoT-type nucleotidyltranferase